MNQDSHIKCFLCGNNVNTKSGRDYDPLNQQISIHCNICGTVKCSNVFYDRNINGQTKLLQLRDKFGSPLDEKTNQKAQLALSYFFKTQIDKNKILTSENLDEILSSVSYPTGLLDKIDLVLEYIHSKTTSFGQEINIYYRDYRLFFCKDINELNEITKYLEEQNYISCYGNTVNPSNPESVGKALDNLLKEKYSISLTANGIKKVEELVKKTKLNQCFVAMWFNKDESKGPNMDKIYSNCMEPVIYNETGYTLMRIDNKEHINYITDEIIKEIRRSKFMIADLTGSRGGVYYEAGFAFGLGIPVIFTCNKNWEENITKECGCIREGIHFDIKQRNIIFWQEDELDKFKEALINRIGAVIGLNK